MANVKYDLSVYKANDSGDEVAAGDIEKMELKNYEELPKTNWLELKVGDRFKYLYKNGELKKGGIIRSITKGDGSFTIAYSSGAGAKVFNLKSTNILKLWKCTVAESPESVPGNGYASLSSEDLREIKRDLEYCKDSISKMHVTLQTIHNKVEKNVKTFHTLVERLRQQRIV